MVLKRKWGDRNFKILGFKISVKKECIKKKIVKKLFFGFLIIKIFLVLLEKKNLKWKNICIRLRLRKKIKSR